MTRRSAGCQPAGPQAASLPDTPRKGSGNWLFPLLAGGALIALTILESRRPLRRRVEERPPHFGRNLTLAGMTAAVTGVLQSPFIEPTLAKVARERLGLVHHLPLSRLGRDVVAFLLLDYTLWHWHYMNHRVALLWRFHLVHHVDLDLDASTAIRFHFGEMSLSIPYRLLQIRLIGASPRALQWWQLALIVSVIFHHSNLELPPAVDRWLSRIFVTPRMHGIHHSTYLDETDSNWSSLLSVWDFLHRTFREDIPQEKITVGVPAYQDPEEVSLAPILTLPFREQKEDWRGNDGLRRVSRRGLE